MPGTPGAMVNANFSKPTVFSLEPLHSQARALAEEKFDLVLPDNPRFTRWRTDADGLMARNAVVTPEDVAVLAVNRLKYISKQGVGVDNFDLPSLQEHGIPLMNTPGINAQAVAELTLALILDVARRVSTIDRRIRRGDRVTKLDGWSGQTLAGRSIGIVGGGHIGLLVGKMFQGAFGGQVYLYDPYLSKAAKDAWQNTLLPKSLTVVSDLNDLLAESHIVSLHCPLVKATVNLIGQKEFEIMRPDAILVNAARGGIVDETALVAALREGKIFGCGLDAFVHEPPHVSDYPDLCEEDGVVLTPHIGAATEQAQQATCLSMVEHLVEAFEGKEMRDRVC